MDIIAFGEYIGEGKSAKTTDRPAFQKMIALAKKPKRGYHNGGARPYGYLIRA